MDPLKRGLRQERSGGGRSSPGGKSASRLSGKGSLFGILFGLAAAFSFGMGHYCRKIALLEVPSPYWGLAIGATVGWLAMVLQGAVKKELRILFRDNFNFRAPPWYFILTGIFTSAGITLIYLALYVSPASLTAVLSSTESLAALVISRIFLGKEEHLNRTVVICIAVVCAGIALMIL